MEMMTTPSGGTRLKLRLRNAANSLLGRTRNRTKTCKGARLLVKNFNRPPRDQFITRAGKFASEVHNAISSRLGHSVHIPGDTVQAIFNDMHLYPSKSQVSEMLQCARQCGRRNGSPFLTFGEFCVFAREMQKPKSHKKPKTNTRCTKRCDVFLGGSCNPTTWRTDIAIPELQKNGITFYNPQKSIWGPELVAEEHDAKQSASVLLYVVDNQTRSVVGMIEVAYLVASKRCVVLVAHPHQPGQTIMGERITHREYTDLVDAQTTLLALVGYEGVKASSNLPVALQYTAALLRGCADEPVTRPLRRLREAFDACDFGADEVPLAEVATAYNRLTNQTLKASDLYNYLAIDGGADARAIRVNFEQFCGLVAELSDTQTDVCESRDIDYDIFLGGARTDSNWRETIAIPLIEERNLTYYSPTIESIDDETRKRKIDGSRVALFVISNGAKALTTMILAAHYIGRGHAVVLCVQNLPEDECILGTEQLSKQAIKDYNRGRVYLTDIAKRKGVPVYENIAQAVENAMNLCTCR